MLATFLRRYWIKQQPKLRLLDTLIISFILCSLSGLFSVCLCSDCTCNFIPPFVLNFFEQCRSCSINIVNAGAIVHIYRLVLVIRVYASNINRVAGFTKRRSPGKRRRIDHWVTVFLFQKKWSKKKKQKKRSREKEQGVWNLPACHTVNPALDKIMLCKWNQNWIIVVVDNGHSSDSPKRMRRSSLI